MKIDSFSMLLFCISFVNCDNNTLATGSKLAVVESNIKIDSATIKKEVVDTVEQHPKFDTDTLITNEEYPFLLFRKSHKPAYYILAEPSDFGDATILHLFVKTDKMEWIEQDSAVVRPYLDDYSTWKVQDLNKDGVDDILIMVDSYSNRESVYKLFHINFENKPKIVTYLPLLSNPRYLKKDNLIESEGFNNRKEVSQKYHYQIKSIKGIEGLKEGKLELIKIVKVKTSYDD